jgi:hypothetical protein
MEANNPTPSIEAKLEAAHEGGQKAGYRWAIADVLPHPPVLSAAVIAYDENGKIHVIAQFPKQPKNVLDS